MSKTDPNSDGALQNLLGSLPDSTVNDEMNAGLLAISRGTAIILLLIYLAYLNFQVRKLAEAFPLLFPTPSTPNTD